jgi:hypothetical protein
VARVQGRSWVVQRPPHQVQMTCVPGWQLQQRPDSRLWGHEGSVYAQLLIHSCVVEIHSGYIEVL